jgi:O-antigen/teichoic acid export membrane protein
MLGQLICSLFGSASIYLNMTGRQNTFKIILIIAVIINFISNGFLVPRYGMVGASISFVISLLFWNICTAIIVYKKDNVNVLIS